MTLDQRIQLLPTSHELAQTTCGVYRSPNCEIVATEQFALVFSLSRDEAILSARLYSGPDNCKKLVAICERNQKEALTSYAYETQAHLCRSNCSHLEALLGEAYDINLTQTMKRLECFRVNHAKETLPTVSQAGIKNCLLAWRMYDSFEANADFFRFYLNTGITEYIFQICPQNTDIYCGASYNIPFDLGLLGGGQFFRIRNFADNSAPWCGFHCDFSYQAKEISIPREECRSGECVQTSQGLMWSVKRYTDEEIVLQGCGTDEYIYCRNTERTESFVKEP